MNKGLKKVLSLVLSVIMVCSSIMLSNITATVSAADTYITEEAGWLESAYVEWTTVPDATGFAAYVKGANEADSAYVRLDNELIRKYPTYFRADALGLKAGQYVMKVVPVINGSLDESKSFVSGVLDVKAHDRSGFAFSASSPNKTASGGYNDDGTVPSNAQIIYVTEETKNTVTLDVIKDSKGTKETATGFGNIMALRQKGYDKTPLIVRMIGQITTPADVNSNNYIQVKGCFNVTVEGVGNDTTCTDWSFLVRDANNAEIRNIGFMNFQDDGVSLDQDNYNIWIHNCDFYYGKKGSGDKIKGDGSLDSKGFDYVTISYNHFWDSGKCNLCGMGESAGRITYHHNWYDYSDSRHPRIRQHTVHVYNNFFDGNSKYGIGATTGSSAFVENNYFRNCKHPMLISMQGSDLMGSTGYTNDNATFSKEAGGMIKAYNNVIEGSNAIELGTGTEPIYYGSANTTDSTSHFDAYLASSRDEKVPSTVSALKGGATYNNFDTASDMYSYTPDAPEDVPTIVTAYAGRMEGSDFFETTGTKRSDFKALTDVNYDGHDHVRDEAFAAVQSSYKTKLVSIGGMTSGGEVDTEATTEKSTEVITEDNTETTTYDEKTIVKDDKLDKSSLSNHAYFTISGGSTNVYAHDSRDAIRLKKSGSITFTVADGATISANAAGANATDAGRTLTLTSTSGFSKTITLSVAQVPEAYPEIVFGENLPAGTYTLKSSADVDVNAINVTFAATEETTEAQTETQSETQTETQTETQSETQTETQTETETETQSTTEAPVPDVPVLYGDADGDGDVDTSDAVSLLNYTLKAVLNTVKGDITVIPDTYMEKIDVNADGVINTADVLEVIQKVLNSSYNMPVENASGK